LKQNHVGRENDESFTPFPISVHFGHPAEGMEAEAKKKAQKQKIFPQAQALQAGTGNSA